MGQWSGHERRLEKGLMPLLDLLDEHNTHATFFVLGWIAKEYPKLIAAVASRGHELASHGYSHTKVYDLSPKAFREEIRSSKALIEDSGGSPVVAYRAPFFSITAKSLWALEILAEEGYRVDCSISPVKTWRYGIEDCPDALFTFEHTSLTEFPTSSFEILGRRWGIGGAYFRLAPYAITAAGIRKRTRARKQTMFYIHPWEYDPHHPRVPMERKAALTHYTRLGVTLGHTAKLLKNFRFDTVARVVEHHSSAGPLQEIAVGDLKG